MVPWEKLGEAEAPGGGVLRLFRRGSEYSIRLGDGNELMNSRLGGSEEALATLSLDRVRTALPRPAMPGTMAGLARDSRHPEMATCKSAPLAHTTLLATGTSV